MSLEASDVNDGAILGATQREHDEKGNARLKIILPSGRELASDYINPEQLSTAIMLTWCESVRAEVAFDGQEAEARLKRDAQMARRDAVMQPPDALLNAIGAPVGGLRPTPPPTYHPSEVDPLAYARENLRIWTDAIRASAGQLQKAETALRDAEVAAKKWSMIVKQLEPIDEL
jgi:prolyl-tRNA editing enzyme YbaK/EbsC (Cys-tRNA(Pro) deacylase)